MFHISKETSRRLVVCALAMEGARRQLVVRKDQAELAGRAPKGRSAPLASLSRPRAGWARLAEWPLVMAGCGSVPGPGAAVSSSVMKAGHGSAPSLGAHAGPQRCPAETLIRPPTKA